MGQLILMRDIAQVIHVRPTARFTCDLLWRGQLETL